MLRLEREENITLVGHFKVFNWIGMVGEGAGRDKG